MDLPKVIPSEYVYFVRHKFSSAITTQLREKQLVAYNYVDEYHEKIQDYSEQSRGLTQSFNVFRAMMATGGLVVIDYENPVQFTIARLVPNQSSEKKVALSREDGEGIYKALDTIEPKTFLYSKFPLMAAVRPMMSTACSPGRTFSQMARHLYLGEPIEYGVDFMHPSSVELMVETFLRSDLVSDSIRLDYTLLRTGKTMPFVDIYGRSLTGQKVFAQVTNQSAPNEKVNGFVDFVSANGVSILFSRDLECEHPGLNQHFCLDEIFKILWKHPTGKYQRFLKELSGIDS
jgi:hypothetical protein